MDFYSWYHQIDMLDLSLVFVPIQSLRKANIEPLIEIEKRIDPPLYMELDTNYIWNTFEDFRAPLLFHSNNNHTYGIRKKRNIHRHPFANLN